MSSSSSSSATSSCDRTCNGCAIPHTCACACSGRNKCCSDLTDPALEDPVGPEAMAFAGFEALGGGFGEVTSNGRFLGGMSGASEGCGLPPVGGIQHCATYVSHLHSTRRDHIGEPVNWDFGMGENWLNSAWPYVTDHGGMPVTVVLPMHITIKFYWDQPAHDFIPNMGYHLHYSSGADLFTMVSPQGEIWTFTGFKCVNGGCGQFRSYTGPGESRAWVFNPNDPDNPNAQLYTAEGHIRGIQSIFQNGEDTITVAYIYEYAAQSAERLATVTYRRKINDGQWQDVKRVVLDYNSSATEDVKTINTFTEQYHEDGQWGSDQVHYYRYYDDGEANGFQYALKFSLDPGQYQALSEDPEVTDPAAASDALVAKYAGQYFEYDQDERVSKRVDLGRGETNFTYEVGGSGSSDYNAWALKTIETRPDGSVLTSYQNHQGQAILDELKASASASDSALDYREYDSTGQLTLHATSSALEGYTVSGTTILPTYKSDGGQYDVGLIHIHEYYTGDESSAGSGPAGYKKAERIKQGRDGTPIVLHEYEYAEHAVTFDMATGSSSSSSSNSSSSGAAGNIFQPVVYPISKETRYRNEDGTGAIVTTYDHAWHPDSLQILQRTTTLPAVLASQNGSGTSASQVERFDADGNLVWTKDERGVISYNDYQSGNLVRTIQDVDDAQITVPDGWSTPSNGGLHVTTDFEYDLLGRQVQTLGPAHDVDGTTVRTATWSVYKDADRQTWTAQGYATGSAGNYTYTLVNPVSIDKRDIAGRTIESIQATRASTSGKLSASDTFAQSSYVRWNASQYNTRGQLVSTRAYHAIPASGVGSSGSNYDETTFGYDDVGRQNMQKTPGGTITRSVFDSHGRAVKSYVGTDDSGATDADPTGCSTSSSSSSSGSCDPDNNMVLVAESEYCDGGTGCSGCGGGGGSGQLISQTQHVDGNAQNSRVTQFEYDWRHRQEIVIPPADDQGRTVYSRQHYDNLDRVVKSERYLEQDPAADILIARSETLYDERGQVYQTKTYAVDPTDGTVGNALVSKTWYDAAGQTIKQQAAGSEQFSKMVYDGLGRPTDQYVGYDTDETSYADASTVVGDTIMSHNLTNYDGIYVTFVQTKQRFHNATGTGALTTPDGSQPKARVSYAAMWYDEIGRPVASADYGTNGGSTFTRPASVPTRSDTILVTTTEYNSSGEAHKTIDPAGREDRQVFDAAGRTLKTIQNYTDGNPSTGTSDEDVTVEMTYNPDGQLSTLTAKNSTTGDQVTKYVYGTAVANLTPEVFRNDLLRAEIYPDSDDTTTLENGTDGVYDRVEFKYNRQGQLIWKKDQNGTIHEFDYDDLGRQTQDRVTTVGSGVDDAVLRIGKTHEVRGMVETISSYDAATSGGTVNQVVFEYDDASLLSKEYQEHAGAKNANTPHVGYNHDTSTSSGQFTKGLRPIALRYPNGRLVHYTYGSTGGTSDALSRIAAIKDDSGGSPGDSLAEYSYLAQNAIVQVDYPEPDLRYDLAHGTGNDPHDGPMDRFGRVTDLLWRNYGTSTDAVRIKHAYDRAGNRLYREDAVAAAHGKEFDELYTYDGVNQLVSLDRGDLNATKTAISGTPAWQEDWSLDPTGNWTAYQQKTATTTDLDQARTHNAVNEITNITETTGPSWITPTHDRNGNTLRIMQPDDPESHYSLTWDAWNRLVKAEDGDTPVATYQYDGRSFRIVKNTYAVGELDQTRHFYYNSNWQCLEERIDTSTEADRHFLWGLRYIDDLVLRDRDKSTPRNGILDERVYSLQDRNWNIMGLGDTSGNIQERYEYDAYGAHIVMDSVYGNRAESSYQWNCVFAGHCVDKVTGLSVCRARDYGRDLGRFITRDPLAQRSMIGVAPYQYGDGNPVTKGDPSGMLSVLYEHRTPGCGERNAFWFDFVLDSAAPCHGYFVQKVEVYKKVTADKTQCPSNVPSPIPFQDTYYEAWSVRKGDHMWAYHNTAAAPDYDDEMGATLKMGTCGLALQKRTLKFYCRSDTGGLGSFGVPPTDQSSRWSPGGHPMAGDLPSVSGMGYTPPFWRLPPVEGPYVYQAHFRWCCFKWSSCCPGGKRYVRYLIGGVGGS